MLSHLDTTDTEFNQRTQHLTTSDLIGSTAHSNLDQKTVVVGLKDINVEIASTSCSSSMQTYSDLSARETRACIETDTIATSTTVDFNLTRVGLEALGGILSRNTALNREATLSDRFLSETKLGQGCTSSDLNLGGDDVDASDFLWQRMSRLLICEDATIE